MTSSALASLSACSSGGGGGTDGGKSSSKDAAKTDASLQCASVCATKATQCNVSASESASACQDFCGTDPSSETLTCVQKTACAQLVASFESAKPLCPIIPDASADAKKDVKIPNPPMKDGSADGGLDGASSDGQANGSDATTDGTTHDATMHDGQTPDSSSDANAGSCTISLSSGETYTCNALASYSPANGTLFTLDSNEESSGGDPYFGMGVTLSSAKDFVAGASYSNPSGTALHQEGQGVWDYSSTQGDGTASVTVTSGGAQWMQDGGTSGDIYYAGAYGDAVLTLAPKDPPFATSPITANIHWVTQGPGAHDGGTDAAHDSSTDGAKEANAGNNIKCMIAISGGTPEPCSSNLTYYNNAFSILTISPMGDGGDSTSITIQFPGDSASVTGGVTSSVCSNATYCNSAVTVRSGSVTSGKIWERSWKSSDEGAGNPWFDLNFSAFGVCPPGVVPGVEVCNSDHGTLTANSIAPQFDGGAPVTVSVTF